MINDQVVDHDDLLFYKFESGSSVNPDPSLNHVGGDVDNFKVLGAITSAFEGSHQAEFHVDGFSGGGAGGIGCDELPCSLVLSADEGDFEAKEELFIAPNPITSESMLFYQSEKQELTFLSIYDLSGRLISAEEIDMVKGMNAVKLSQELPVGMFLVSLQTSGGVLTSRVFVE